jgi:hypothetical protein
LKYTNVTGKEYVLRTYINNPSTSNDNSSDHLWKIS